MRTGFNGLSSAGLTLPEVLLAAVIMVLSILPVVGVFRAGLGGQQVQIKRMGAVQVAQDYMNKCLAAEFDDITTISLGDSHKETVGGVDYDISIEIENINSVTFNFKERAPVPTDPPVVKNCSIADSLKKVTVEVQWWGMDKGKMLSFVLTSFRSRIQTD